MRQKSFNALVWILILLFCCSVWVVIAYLEFYYEIHCLLLGVGCAS